MEEYTKSQMWVPVSALPQDWKSLAQGHLPRWFADVHSHTGYARINSGAFSKQNHFLGSTPGDLND